MEKRQTVDIRVKQKPISVEWDCPGCDNGNSTPYNESLNGDDYCDWKYSIIECEHCGNKFKIDDIDWD